MTTWTLAIDESGRFEGDLVPGETGESVALLVGGLLVPSASQPLDDTWYKSLSQLCDDQSIAYPPHGSALRECKTMFVDHVAAAVAATSGRWLFVVAPPPQPDERLAIYVRMLGEVVELTCRLVAGHGGSKLEAHVAQRTPPIANHLWDEFASKGMGQALRPVSNVEVRQIVDALGREDLGALPVWPTLELVHVAPAASSQTHAGIAMADLACNHLYGQLRDARNAKHVPALAPESESERVMVVGREAIPMLRRVDRALRSTPPDLVRACCAAVILDARARGRISPTSPFPIARVGASALAAEWIVTAADVLASTPSTHVALAAQLAAQVHGHLAAKSGDYEGTWRALEIGWCGSGPLATAVRSSVTDRELAARLWRLCLECANHRGDVAAGDRAARAFHDVLAVGPSLAMVAERLVVENLTVVMTQNRYLPDPVELPTIAAQLAEQTRRLASTADEAGVMVEIAGAGAARHWPLPGDELEASLWRHVGATPAWQSPDRERGRCYGTVARSRAFLGQLDAAREMVLRARTFFADSAFDLAFNAAVLARIELERIRTTKTGSPQLLEIALRLAGALDLGPAKDVAQRVRHGASLRFAIDLLLCAFLWCPRNSFPVDPWLAELRRAGDASLLAILSADELRTHPTDLLARHAGELLRRAGHEKDAIAWFGLSCEIAAGSARGSTTARMGEFTAALMRDRNYVSSEPAGSVRNPVFEYR